MIYGKILLDAVNVENALNGETDENVNLNGHDANEQPIMRIAYWP